MSSQSDINSSGQHLQARPIPTRKSNASESSLETLLIQTKMASQPKSTPRRIPGAPPVIFLEGALPVDTPPNPSKHKTKIQEMNQLTDSKPFVSNYSYGADDIPVFGRPFGMPVSAQRGESSATGAMMATQELPQRKRPKKSLNPYEEMLMEADSDLEKYVGAGGKPTASFMPSSSPYSTPTVTPSVRPVIPTAPLAATKPSFRTKLSDYFRRPGSRPHQEEPDPLDDEISPPQFITTAPPPTECSICTEEFTPKLKPPAWITLTCIHQPSVCTPCLSLSIRADLENKIWSNIRCPEEGCDAMLIYEDVKRLADAITFSRYEILSFRSAVSTDPNFVWCQKCNFGQLHPDGIASPIVNCLNCNNRTCFTHQVPWHTGMTCAEYDSMVADPDNFVPEMDRSNAAALLVEQEEAAATKEREEVHKERLAEQERQRAQHVETRRKAMEIQKQEARKKRAAWEQGELKRRLKEEKASLAKVEGTTKKCPGCKWPIEKNSGCAHMTCTQCKHEFCWKCLRLWAGHGTAC